MMQKERMKMDPKQIDTVLQLVESALKMVGRLALTITVRMKRQLFKKCRMQLKN